MQKLRILTTVIAGCALSAPPALAQQSMMRQGDVVQVSVTYHVLDAAVPNEAGAKADRHEALRRLIYDAANRECRTLEQAFQQSCRMTGLNVQPLNRGMPRGPSGMQGSASYQLSLPPR
jgi:hypothetical protein